MNTNLGYSKNTIADTSVLLAHGGTAAINTLNVDKVDGKDATDFILKDSNTAISYTTGYLATNSTNIGAFTNNASWSYVDVQVKKGDKFLIKGRGGSTPRLYAFADTSNKIITRAADTLLWETSFHEITAGQDGRLVACFNTGFSYQLVPLSWVSGYIHKGNITDYYITIAGTTCYLNSSISAATLRSNLGLGTVYSHAHTDYVTGLSISGNTLAWSKGGTALTALTIPYATNCSTSVFSKYNRHTNIASTMYVSGDTHYMYLGYMDCSGSYDRLTLLITSAFWGNQHGSLDLITILLANNTNATAKVLCTLGRIWLGGSTERKFYYLKEGSTKLHLYVYVTGGNSYGAWTISCINSDSDRWHGDGTANVTASDSWVEIEYSGKVNYALTAGSAPASDVYSWAKASTKPSYTYSEVGAAAASHTHTSIKGLGALDSESGRTAARGGVYSYKMASTTGGYKPTTYAAVIGFGEGAGGTGEIAVGWTGGVAQTDDNGGYTNGIWYRGLRDYLDNWYGWTKLLDTHNWSTYCAAAEHTHSLYLTTHLDISGKHPLNGKITIAGGSYKWYAIQLFNSSGANPAYYAANCAIINITSYSGWLPWIRAVDSENGSWAIGLYTNQFHIGRIPANNTSNDLTYLWTCGNTGNFTISGSFYANSDIRYKNVLEHITPTAESISTLPIINYTWKDRDDEALHTGTSAQDVELILPNLVTEKEGGFKSLDYATLGVVAGITACREITSLRKEVDLLKELIKLLTLALKNKQNRPLIMGPTRIR